MELVKPRQVIPTVGKANIRERHVRIFQKYLESSKPAHRQAFEKLFKLPGRKEKARSEPLKFDISTDDDVIWWEENTEAAALPEKTGRLKTSKDTLETWRVSAPLLATAKRRLSQSSITSFLSPSKSKKHK